MASLLFFIYIHFLLNQSFICRAYLVLVHKSQCVLKPKSECIYLNLLKTSEGQKMKSIDSVQSPPLTRETVVTTIKEIFQEVTL